MKKVGSLYVDDGFQWKLSLFYVALFLAVGCYLPYFPAWLAYGGMNETEVALILSAPMIVRVIFSPLVSAWADHDGNTRKILILLSFGSLFSLLCYLSAQGFWALFLITIIYSIFGSGLIPITEAMAMTGQRDDRLHYGRARSWGSASFIVGSLLGGFFVDQLGAQSVLWFLIASSGFIVFAAFLLPRPQGQGRLRGAISGGAFSLKRISLLLQSGLFWLFLLAVGFVQASHAFYYGFATLYWQSTGLSGTSIGILWALGVVAEILLFVLIGGWLKQFNPALLILIGAGLAVLRWVFTGVDPAFWLLVPIQMLHAFSFGLTHLGAMYFIARAVHERAASTAQGLHATMTMGILMGVMVLISGPLYKAINVQGFFVMAFSASIGAVMAVLLFSYWRGGEFILSDESQSNRRSC